MMKSFYYITLFLILFFMSCSYSSSGSGGDGGDGNEGSTTPEISTVKWEANGEDIQFYTNDMSMLRSNGSTYWSPRSYLSAGLTADVIEANVCKMSGMTGYGYGLIFCIQDDPPVSGAFVAKNFYCVLIRVDGFYQIIKAVWDGNPDHAPIQHILQIDGSDWKEALNMETPPVNVINKGKGANNNIRVVITDPDNNDHPDFAIYFNGYNIHTFEDNFLDDEGVDLTQFLKSAGEYKYGFIVTLAPDESFPYVPVDVRFDQIVPDYSTGIASFSIKNFKSVLTKVENIFFENSTAR